MPNRRLVRLLVLTFAVIASQVLLAAPLPAWKKGDHFAFQLAKGSPTSRRQVTDANGASLVRGLPDRQTVLVKEAGPCQGNQGKPCITLQIDREVPPPDAALKDAKFTEQILAEIDTASGDILS